MANKKKCGSPLRNKPGRFCQIERGLMSNGRCQKHGGKSLRGIAHPNFTNGATSRYMLPLRMRESYNDALSDPKLLDLKPEIALVHARAKDLIDRVDSGESGHLWKLLQKAYTDLETAKDKAEQLVALATLGQLIKRGTADYAAWTETMKEIDRKRVLVESERKRAVELHQMVALDSIKPYLYDTIDYIRRYITDRAKLAEYQRIVETRLGTGVTTIDTTTVGDHAGEDSAADESADAKRLADLVALAQSATTAGSS